MNWPRAKVVVTGGAGFLGSHLCEALVARGARVVVVDNFSAGSLENLNAIAKDLQVVHAHLGDPTEKLDGAMEGDLLIHLAGIADPRQCREDFDLAFYTNVVALQSVLARSKRYTRVIVLSSAAVYGNPTYVPIDEQHPINGTDPYAMTKILGEQVCRHYVENLHAPITMVRNFNTFGPRQSRAFFIPQLIAQAVSQKAIEIWNGDSIRDFMYVSDWIQAVLAIAGTDQTIGQAINVGSGRGVRVGDLADMIAGIFRIPVVDLKRPLTGSLKLICDNTRLNTLTHWTPLVSLDEGLRQTIDGFRPHG